MQLDVAGIRTGIADIATNAVPETTWVYPSGLEPGMWFPCIVVDQPSWTPPGQLDMPYPLGRLRWPVRVVLEKPGTQDPTTVDVLDHLWTSLLEAFEAATNRVGFCSNLIVDHAEFGVVRVQAQEYPAQSIFVDTY